MHLIASFSDSYNASDATYFVNGENNTLGVFKFGNKSLHFLIRVIGRYPRMYLLSGLFEELNR